MTNNNTMHGFHNYQQSEALENALPTHQNSPQKVPYHLYAEQLSGSAFTAPRHNNFSVWLYRLLPSVCHSEFIPYKKNLQYQLANPQSPNQLRFSPYPFPDKTTDFIDGLHLIAHNDNANIFIYTLNSSMEQRYFSNSDGEMLIVPEYGDLSLLTELGELTISPGEIAIIPRGIKYQINVQDKARGYICENLQHLFRLPELGPIGANGLANPHDFICPHAKFEDKQERGTLITKYQHQFWQCELSHSPFDVVAWRGNYFPYKYDLSLFNTINTVSFDHPDPSIFTVLTAPSNTPGVANIDFVIFPERWMVAEHTFRPPYFHRNIMSEFMGLIKGSYDAKQNDFVPGGFSIHNRMSGHGPDAATYVKAIDETLTPKRYENTLAFMFESVNPWLYSKQAYDHASRQKKYQDCWQGLKKHFTGKRD